MSKIAIKTWLLIGLMCALCFLSGFMGGIGKSNNDFNIIMQSNDVGLCMQQSIIECQANPSNEVFDNIYRDLANKSDLFNNLSTTLS